MPKPPPNPPLDANARWVPLPKCMDPDYPGGKFYRLTIGDLAARAFGWACLGFAIGWIAGQAVMR